MKEVATFISLILAGCSTGPAPQSHQWLVGAWLEMDEAMEFRRGCNSGWPIRYADDGTYSKLNERGTWRLRGDSLTQTATALADDSADPPDPSSGRWKWHVTAIGLPRITRIRQVNAEEFIETFANGETATFRRCPPAER